MEVRVAGEELVLRGDRSVYWPERRTLLMADLHLGKETSFRARGAPVPTGASAETLRRASRAVQETGAERVFVLGDLWHARDGCDERVLRGFEEWRAGLGAAVFLIEGNHDRSARAACELPSVPEWREGPFVLRHEPGHDREGYVLAGHIHPGITLSLGASDAPKLPCFWFGSEGGVLPAFGEFTGLAAVFPRAGDRTYAVAEGRVMDVTRIVEEGRKGPRLQFVRRR